MTASEYCPVEAASVIFCCCPGRGEVKLAAFTSASIVTRRPRPCAVGQRLLACAGTRLKCYSQQQRKRRRGPDRRLGGLPGRSGLNKTKRAPFFVPSHFANVILTADFRIFDQAALSRRWPEICRVEELAPVHHAEQQQRVSDLSH